MKALPFLILAACSASVGASAITAKGAPVVADLHGDGAKRITFVTLTSPSRWECRGQFAHDDAIGRSKSSVTVPLTCSDGGTGTGIMAVGPRMSKLSMAFSLSNGDSGTITF